MYCPKCGKQNQDEAVYCRECGEKLKQILEKKEKSVIETRNMFGNLTNFAYKRSVKEAVGFYIVYSIIFMVFGGILGGLSAALTPISFEMPQEEFDLGYGVGSALALILNPCLTLLVLRAKKFQWTISVILFIFDLMLSYIGGGLLGCLLPSFLTTREVANNKV